MAKVYETSYMTLVERDESYRLQHKVVQVVLTSRKQMDKDSGIWKIEPVLKEAERKADCAGHRN